MKEIDVEIQKILSNDWDPEAAGLIKKNFDFNEIPEENTEVTAMDAVDMMYERRKMKDFYDVIDLDPYGTATPFIDSTIQAIENGGLLWVTFTDTAVLCTSKPHVCFYKYGSVATHKKNCHEYALRMVLHTIASVANRYQRQIYPLLSLTADFYIRLFVQIGKPGKGALMCHDSIVDTSYVFQCNGCQSFHLHSIGKALGKKEKKEKKENQESSTEQSRKDRHHNTKYTLNPVKIPEKWENWNSSFVIGGPIWTGEIHDIDFINSLSIRAKDWSHLGTHSRITKTLEAIKNEMSLGNYPLSMDYDRLISEIKAESISKKLIHSAFRSLGYGLVQTYYKPNLFKTNAPHKVVYDIFKAWKKKCFEGKNKELTDKWSGVALEILSKPIEKEPDFEYEQEKVEEDLKKNHVKYTNNPPNWGPGHRATNNAQNKKLEKKAKEKVEEDEKVNE